MARVPINRCNLLTTINVELSRRFVVSVNVKLRFCALALLVCATALCQTAAPISSLSLTLETTGHGFWKPREPFVFRIYSTQDGTKARVDYLTFHSRDEAQQYLQTCLRPRTRIIYRQEKKGPGGRIIGERIVAVRQESGKEEFALIRGVRLNYYLIGSSSLAAAIQVEEEVVEE